VVAGRSCRRFGFLSSLEVSMRTRTSNVLLFIPLRSVMQQLGARSQPVFLADLRTLSDRERRQVADLVTKEG
jgi:hypothetical protein